MVMFKARFHAPEPVPGAGDEPPKPDTDDQPRVPPIEEERGPQAPVELPGPGGAPERASAVLLSPA
ncbi:MAG: hypothetical protein EOO24_11885 [Comamonadaceae bacterium]|nr:MAG: hypothetical protein EOO24_11885 [Comamonadaceae bacterium]